MFYCFWLIDHLWNAFSLIRIEDLFEMVCEMIFLFSLRDGLIEERDEGWMDEALKSGVPSGLMVFKN